ncbi:hypothetical protein [uncultured Microbacterium sp.]|uniref:hypothetical protein n=1 Tax=uncultured Microbacterium sp. TaxID=191216 RepID=UPI0028EE4B5C|nr:hypothetical protein [uncultured Microbacterium sp.]
MTIINPTQIVQPVTPPKIGGFGQDEQLQRLRELARDVSRRFIASRDTTEAVSYVFRGEEFDASAHADSAAYLVASTLAYVANILESINVDAWPLDATASKQFRKGYRAALDQVGTEMLEAISFAI